eukprot:TRINITY_DN12591_c0_g1_i2.p1 TRINITY_DN12591_c0_g1~~TRINITY_DN12591_c0_g1_i2.p1  ORF type:complete len:365 (+),score=77.46 TRINITY_DN12591_c0_g1_i2:64-1158(+)
MCIRDSSTGIQAQSHEVIIAKDGMDDLELQHLLLEFGQRSNRILFVEGGALGRLIEKHPKLFFEVASTAPAVVCCRCLPTQKALVAERLRALGVRVAAVGDGGNDVGMIQSSDVGIGIVGKEGTQAALASDFSILCFRDLRKLILWHGRNAYKRSSTLAQFVIHRGLIISIIQLFFTLTFYYVAISIYNGFLLVGYTTLYTSLPVFCLIFDEDIDLKNLLKFPILYSQGQKGRELSSKTFLLWIWKSIYQGGLIFYLGLFLFDRSFLVIVTITFTALIFSELLNVYSELHRVHPVMVVSQLLTLVVYMASIFFLNQYINTKALTPRFLMIVCGITLASWGPLHLIQQLRAWWAPSEQAKIMNAV